MQTLEEELRMDIQRLTEILTEAYYDKKHSLESSTLEHLKNNNELYRKEILSTKSKKLLSMYNYIIYEE